MTRPQSEKLLDAWPFQTLASIEQRVILRTIQMTGSKKMAAKRLGIGRTTLYRKLKKYRLAEYAPRGREVRPPEIM